MAPRKKQYSTRSEKQRAYEERQRAGGRRRVCVWITDEAAGALDRIAKELETDRGGAIEHLASKAK